MNLDRDRIRVAADIVRDRLSLCVPISLDTLRDTIVEKLPGRCIPVDKDTLDADAQIRTLDHTRFEIRYLNDRPTTRTLSVLWPLI